MIKGIGLTKIVELESKYGLKIQFNRFLLNDIRYPHLFSQAKSNNLLSEFELLKSDDPNLRKKAIERLIKKETEASYSIILEHWTHEKNETIRDLILKRLINKK